MMREQTLAKLRAMKLNGMASGYTEQAGVPDVHSLPFDERFGLLVDQEESDRQNRRYQARLRTAKLREKAQIEDLDLSPARGLDKSVVLALAACDWIAQKQNILITGPTGAGKTFVSCALAHKAMQRGYSSRYARLPRLLEEMQLAKASGRYLDLLASLARVDVLVIDDWGLAPLDGEQRRDFLELVEDRYGTRSLLMASQLPVDQWFDVVGDSTIADAIMDRIIHCAHRIELRGESGRKRKSPTKPLTSRKEG